VSTKQRLIEFVEGLDEHSAQEILLIIENEAAPREPLTHEQLESIARGLAQSAAGKGIPHDDVFRRLLSE